MNTRDKKAKSIFLDALEITTAPEQQAYLEAACSGDEALRREVEELLSHHGGLGSFLAEPPVNGGAATADVPPVLERPGKEVGPYKLLEEIGEGGFGVVYMAEQEEPVRRRVALKVIKPGMDSRDVIARFDAERQALALMDHPNVARVLDAGATSQGRPFFVMDLIKGIPITEYADQASLSTRERLDLFLEVCQGVQHAHQKGIIHRDLKPTNVLVTLHGSKAVPKVIDFGVAKAIHQRLTERTLYTRYAQMVGTPLYMSPEQAALSGLDVDTRSDIYSLGVLLYELLTGTTPLDRGQLGEASYDEIRQAIRETEPPTPSQRLATTEIETLKMIATRRQTEPRKVAELLRGDLDWITMKALEKDRTRRYETASAFAQDIGRYLADEPVEARPPSRLYRARKFARRNRGALWLAGCALVALAAVIGSAGWLVGERAARLGEAARQAEVALADARAAIRRHDWPAARIAATRAQGLVVSRGSRSEIAGRVDGLLRDLDLVARLERIRLETVDRGAGVGLDLNGDAARFEQAFEEYGLPIGMLSASDAGERIRARPIALELAEGLGFWASSLRNARRKDAPSWKHLVAVAQEADPDSLRSQVRRLWQAGNDEALANLAESVSPDDLTAFSVTRISAALKKGGARERRVAFLKSVQRERPENFWFNFDLSDSLGELRRWDEAERYAMIAVALRPKSSIARNHLGFALLEQGDVSEARKWFKKGLELDPDYFGVHHNLGTALARQGDLARAIERFKKAIELKPDFSPAHMNLGLALHYQGDIPGAIERYKKALELKPDYPEAHNNLGNALREQGDEGDLPSAIEHYKKALVLKPDYPKAHSNLGNALRDQGDLPSAIERYKKALEIKPDYPEAHYNLGCALAAKGDLSGAIERYKKALELKPDYPEAHYNLGCALAAKGDLSGAIERYKKALELKPDFVFAHVNLGSALRDQGDLPSAIEHYKKALEFKPDFVLAHVNLGVALQNHGNLADAIQRFQKALELEPGNARVHFILGRTLLEQDDLSAAIAHFGEAIDLVPHSDDWYDVFWSAVEHHPDLRRAIAQYRVIDRFEKAIEIMPENAAAHTRLGDALDDLRKLPEALACYEEALRLDRDYAPAHFGLGNVRRHQGDFPEAIVCYKKALELKPEYGWAYQNLGVVYDAQGNHSAAIDCHRKSVALDPSSYVRHINLGRALARSGDLPGAVFHWLEALELSPNDPSMHNDLAWMLATIADPRVRDAKRAVKLVKKAVELAPEAGHFWNTLGVAQYRAGDYGAAVVALEKSVDLQKGGNGFDWFFLAMGQWQLGRKEQARRWYAKAVEWTEENAKENDELRRFRVEAEELMGTSKTTTESQRE